MTNQTNQTPEIVTLWRALSAHQAGVSLARAELRLIRLLGYQPTDQMVCEHVLIDQEPIDPDDFASLTPEVIVLDAVEFSMLCEMLDAEPVPSPRLAELLARPTRITR